MSYEDVTSDPERNLARSIRGGDGGPDAPDRDASGSGLDTGEASAPGSSSSTDEQGLFNFQVAQRSEGPIPPPHVLAGYENVVPGSAKQLIDAHLHREKVSTDAIERLTKSESISVTIGTIAAPALMLVGLIAGVVLTLSGSPAAAIAAFIPAVLGGAATIVSARKGGKA